MTSGGTSTCPETFAGRLQVYEEKTVRYPGHLAQLQAMKDLGLLDATPIAVGDVTVTPREVFEALMTPRVTFPDDPDVIVLRVACRGQHGADEVEVTLDLIDFHDNATGFTAMERTTGSPAAMVVAMMARGQTPRGAVPLELAVPAQPTVEALGARGIQLSEQITTTRSL